MDAISAYSFATLAWLTAQSVPLIVWPTFISSLLTPNYQHANRLAQLTLGIVVVSLSGALPLTSLVDTPADAASPYANAVIFVSTLYHASQAFYSYNKFNGSDAGGYFFGALGSAVLAAFGLWCLMFAGDKGHISKRTGADKRTSGWPFKNSEASKKKGKNL
ncbi:hypothetical protein M406DRAFT_332895 [Cryphonectria parasitica EP155]|uniref:Uncharacterized protein n=1 Tax=Cryphonectria parasitica (strain ATCC 38755 / EP155) TaxID=660469 RepID=A0A9P5CKY4_CRYP1|nr:uncharacterized protein M406DRAFT_332895 [Cryphonectria parasitica EP155]KAF3762513.1 hypothetical protein M406DRAFT_332895 [Cryphonectria parasitica EP155]